MTVAQGFDGDITHQGPWRYALDFIRTDKEFSYRDQGAQLTDFLAFDQPVVSPAWGRVAACRDDIADNLPGTMNLIENWGNYVLIDIGGGLCILLAHLRQCSLHVSRGWTVTPGTPIARCGNSGRSAQPHLHLHVMDGRDPLASDGLPYVFDDFTVTAVDEVGTADFDRAEATGSPLTLTPRSPPLHQRGRLPLDLSVVRWADAPPP